MAPIIVARVPRAKPQEVCRPSYLTPLLQVGSRHLLWYLRDPQLLRYADNKNVMAELVKWFHRGVPAVENFLLYLLIRLNVDDFKQLLDDAWVTHLSKRGLRRLFVIVERREISFIYYRRTVDTLMVANPMRTIDTLAPLVDGSLLILEINNYIGEDSLRTHLEKLSVWGLSPRLCVWWWSAPIVASLTSLKHMTGIITDNDLCLELRLHLLDEYVKRVDIADLCDVLKSNEFPLVYRILQMGMPLPALVNKVDEVITGRIDRYDYTSYISMMLLDFLDIQHVSLTLLTRWVGVFMGRKKSEFQRIRRRLSDVLYAKINLLRRENSDESELIDEAEKLLASADGELM